MSFSKTVLIGAMMGAAAFCAPAHAGDAAVYQWSVPVENAGQARAFLWIPADCQRVRAVVVGQNNMLEQGIFAHPAFRRTLGELGMAEVWIAPVLDPVFRFDQGAGERFEAVLRSLAHESGYGELAFAPVVPIGHSACASYPWNFAAWNPARTLAILSVKGDAPRTNMTGSGKPNPDWGNRTIDGIPGLMVMGEYEWLEGRLAPALAFRREHPKVPLAMLPDPAHGHFDCSDGLVDLLALFLRKAVAARLPADAPTDHAPALRPVDPEKGWRVERWRPGIDHKPGVAPMAQGKDHDDAQDFWAFDQQTAELIRDYRANQAGKKPQLLGFVQDGRTVPQTDTAEQVRLSFAPEADGVTFHVATTFLDAVDGGSHNPARWTGLPAGNPLGHADGGGPITVTRIIGPATRTGEDAFVVSPDRMFSTGDRRANDLWLLASHPGDGEYKSAVQQALLRIAPQTQGTEQRITFPAIPDQTDGAEPLKLTASSDAGAPVRYYVREGPAEIDGDTLRLTAIPPRSRFPVKVTVVAWQWGRTDAPALKAAEPVERTFSVIR